MFKFRFLLLSMLSLFSVAAEEGKVLPPPTLQQQIAPYQLPAHHPLKPKLDQIFKQPQPLVNETSLKQAGFKFKLRKSRFMIVASHPQLKGYLVKLYLDTHLLREPEWVQWIRRIRGAQCIRDSIEEHGYHELLKVPQKWIYALPGQAIGKPGPNLQPKKYILIVEDMQIVPHGKNAAKYRFMMDQEHLEALFTVLKENLLIDSMFLDNIPFSKDHKIAFIDTEHFHSHLKPMPYEQLHVRLSPKMQRLWSQLTKK